MGTVTAASSKVQRKVVGASAGAGVGGVTASLIVWALDDYVFDPNVANSVPDAVSGFVLVCVPLALAFVGGYFTKRSAADA